MTTALTARLHPELDEEDAAAVKAASQRLRKAGWGVTMLIGNSPTKPVMVLKAHGFEQGRLLAEPGWTKEFATRLGLKSDGDLSAAVIEELWLMCDVVPITGS